MPARRSKQEREMEKRVGMNFQAKRWSADTGAAAMAASNMGQIKTAAIIYLSVFTHTHDSFYLGRNSFLRRDSGSRVC